MSAKSAVKVLVPRATNRPLSMGRRPHRLEERAQGRRLLPRRVPALGARVSDPRWSMAGGTPSSLLVVVSCPPRSVRRSRSRRSAASFRTQRHQSTLAGQGGALCRTRCLVRRQRAAVPRDLPGLDVHRDWDVHGAVGDRLRRGPGSLTQSVLAQDPLVIEPPSPSLVGSLGIALAMVTLAIARGIANRSVSGPTSFSRGSRSSVSCSLSILLSIPIWCLPMQSQSESQSPSGFTTWRMPNRATAWHFCYQACSISRQASPDHCGGGPRHWPRLRASVHSPCLK